MSVGAKVLERDSTCVCGCDRAMHINDLWCLRKNDRPGNPGCGCPGLVLNSEGSARVGGNPDASSGIAPAPSRPGEARDGRAPQPDDADSDLRQTAEERLLEQIAASRKQWVAGTPEKYPGAELRGLTILEAEALAARLVQVEAALRHVVYDSPGTPDSVKKYLLRALEGSWGEPYEAAALRVGHNDE